MASKRCRLYDENLVHNIMQFTGLSVQEYLRENVSADSNEICDFIESNADGIINDTLRHLKKAKDLADTGDSDDGGDDDTGEWAPGEETR